MDTAVDIYIKLVVALLSFTTPVIVYLLSVSSEGVEILKKRRDEQSNQVSKILRLSLNEGDTAKDKDILNRHLKELRTIEINNNKQIQLLNPKKQITRIFGSLFTSLLLVTCSKCFLDSNFYFNNQLAGTLCGILSLASFCYSIVFLRDVSRAIIEIKEIMATEKVEKYSPKPKTVKSSSVKNGGE